MALTDICRFWSRVAIRGPGQCWEWQAGKSKGYGLFYPREVRPERGRYVYAHRYALALARFFESEAHIRHDCDNPACCNPAHLIPGTAADNMEDKRAKGRARGVAPGSEHHGAKLTETDVQAIRSCSRNTKALAGSYGVDPSTIRRARRGRNWKHVGQ